MRELTLDIGRTYSSIGKYTLYELALDKSDVIPVLRSADKRPAGIQALPRYFFWIPHQVRDDTEESLLLAYKSA